MKNLDYNSSNRRILDKQETDFNRAVNTFILLNDRKNIQ